jgi:hypothetical protein
MPMRRVNWAPLALAAALAASPASSQDLTGDRAIGEVTFSDDTMQLRYRDSGRKVEAGSGSRG